MEAAAPLPGGARRSRSSGRLLAGPDGARSDAQLLEEALGRLSGATAAITANVRRINGALERLKVLAQQYKYPALTIDSEAELQQLKVYPERIQPLVKDGVYFMHQALH